MRLADVVQLRDADWRPEPAKPHNLTDDDRYMGYRSVYEVSGDILQEAKDYFTAVMKSGKPLTSWDRVMWDAPWERPENKHINLLFIHTFEGVDDFLARSRAERVWLHTVGMRIHDCLAKVIEPGDIHKLTHAWGEFARDAVTAHMSPRRDQDPSSYVMEVEQVMRASLNLKTSWFDFLDTTVMLAQRGMNLETPPIFVFLFLDFHLSPGGAEPIIRTFRKMSHPRLLCLFGREPE